MVTVAARPPDWRKSSANQHAVSVPPDERTIVTRPGIAREGPWNNP